MRKLTPEDKLDNLLCSVPLEQAESMLLRAEMVMKIRRAEAARAAKQAEATKKP